MHIEKVLLPDLGDVKDSKVIEVLVKPGDSVEKEQSLMVLESEKASMEMPSPYSGVVTTIKVQEDTIVNIGDLLIELEVTNDLDSHSDDADLKKEETDNNNNSDEGEHDKSKPSPSSTSRSTTDASGETISAEVNPPSPKSPPTSPSTADGKHVKDLPTTTTINQQKLGAKYHASPMIRQFANKLGVDLSVVKGSGVNGRITQEDVENWVENRLQTSAEHAHSSGLPKPPTIDFTQFGDIEHMALGRIKKISGVHLSACWLNAPHVVQFDEVCIDELEQYRQQYNQKAINSQDGIKLTPLVFFLKAVSKTLADFPLFNASLTEDKEALVIKKYIHIGVAVDTPNGLVVPVIRDVPDKGIKQLAQELKELSQKAREGKLFAKDMQGGCFTISSLGGIGGTHFTPIINLPEVAILGIGKSSIKPHWNGKEFTPKLRLPISVSYDHRVIDGAEGARFIVKLGEYLSDIRNLIL